MSGSTTTAPAALTGAGPAPVAARGLRAAALRGAVGVRGRIPSGSVNKATTTASAGSESPVRVGDGPVAARGLRVAALRSLVGASGRAAGEVGSAA
ncbi:hypothetical protein [Streptomyces sp. AK08-02]|uniref:hypothetical protein n=1 Tax=Streptomyces sp. AK08-02 TaxID=3028654 RepID=UPI0029A7FC0C|nr:hypothetical protein [Streptomyces sp. AK08-02]MDX3746235.1 hypothetical protein [Streptomyces sp. AK08-02]